MVGHMVTGLGLMNRVSHGTVLGIDRVHVIKGKPVFFGDQSAHGGLAAAGSAADEIDVFQIMAQDIVFDIHNDNSFSA